MRRWEVGDLVQVRTPFGIGWRVYRIHELRPGTLDPKRTFAGLQSLDGTTTTGAYTDRLVDATVSTS